MFLLLLFCFFLLFFITSLILFMVGLRDHQIAWPVGFMPPCSLAVRQYGGPRPALFMQSRQSRGRPSNTKCLINLLICCACRAWKACFFAIWGQENPVPCYLQTHKHTRTHSVCLPTIWPTFMCCGGNKDRITLDYLRESTTRGQASYWLLTHWAKWALKEVVRVPKLMSRGRKPGERGVEVIEHVTFST